MDSSIENQLAQLRQLYLKELPVRLNAILDIYHRLGPAAWNTEDAATLHRLVHSLTGSAGTFGLQSISKLAREVERLIQPLVKSGNAPTEAEWLTFTQKADHLHKLIDITLVSGNNIAPQNVEKAAADHSHPLVYLVDDDPDHLSRMEILLSAEGFRMRGISSVAEFREYCANPGSEIPAALIMDMIFPEGDFAGAEMIAEMKAKGSACPPVIFVSARDDIDSRLAALRSGATRYLAKPVTPARLIDMLDEITGRQPAIPYQVLMVDDDSDLLAYQAGILRQAGMEVRTLDNPLQTIEACREWLPDVVVLDVYMPRASGPEIAAILRENESFQQTPILFLSAENDLSQQMMALSLGGDDFLVKPVKPDHLAAAVTARARRYRYNISISHRLEKMLYEREREHLALNQHAIVSMTDASGNIIYANEKFCEISGYTQDELTGKNHRMLKSGRHPEAYYQQLWQTISSGKVWKGIICNRRKDGSLYWVESTITPFLDDFGKPYQYISIRTDISQIKFAEIELQESLYELNSAQALAHVGSWNINYLTGSGKWSDETYRIYGHRPGSLENPSAQFISQLHPDDKAKLQEITRQVKQEGFAEYELRIVRPDGSIRHLAEKMYGINDAHGQLIELHGITQDITEKVLFDGKLSSSQERLRRGQEFANIGTWDWNIQTGELIWTDRIAPLFGYPVGELETTYENFVNAIHPDDRKLVSDAVSNTVEHDAPYEIEHRVVWPDGTVRWLLEKGAVVRDSEGKPLQMLGVVQDIDDRKRAELSLAEREKQLREAQALAHIGNWSADIRTGELHWSDEIYRIFGYEPGAFSPSVSAFKKTIHPDDVKLVEASEKNAEKSGQHNVVHRIIWPDGTVRHVHELAHAELDSNGKLIRLSGTVQDITEQIEAENRLRESEERFSFAVIGAGDGIWDWNILTGDMPLSGHYETMLGFESGELEPTISAWIKSVHPEDLPNAELNLNEYLEGKTNQYSIELRLLCKDGSYKWVLCRGTIVERDRNGKPVRMIGIHSDITERKAVEAAMISATEEANRANQAKSEFLSSMSHELRTPMNAILGFAQLLQYDDNLNEDLRDNVLEIIKAGDHLLQLINEVLDLAKVESGNIDLSLEPVDLGTLLDECLALIGIIAESNRITILHADMANNTVRADRTRLKQVLLNLLSNAIKYNRIDGNVRIETRAADPGILRILVKDTGKGIPEQKLKELFQPFNRLGAETSAIEGTGIGLTLSKRLIEMMGGSVGVESVAGEGSTFWIDLPLESAPESPASVRNTDTHVSDEVNSSTSHLILYIEDNPSNLRLMAQILGKRKHIKLLTAHTPELGIELATVRQPELILLDINMPDMDGYQVLNVIRANRELKDIPVVAVTANAMPRDIERGMSVGFNEYITKPIDLGKLYGVLDRFLQTPGDT